MYLLYKKIYTHIVQIPNEKYLYKFTKLYNFCENYPSRYKVIINEISKGDASMVLFMNMYKQLLYSTIFQFIIYINRMHSSLVSYYLFICDIDIHFCRK